MLSFSLGDVKTPGGKYLAGTVGVESEEKVSTACNAAKPSEIVWQLTPGIIRVVQSYLNGGAFHAES